LALVYWSRILFVKHLLPLLIVASSIRSTYNRRVINILGAGFEFLDIPSTTSTLRDPQNFGLTKVVQQGATLNTLTLARLAADPAHEKVVFIHNQLGEVKTDIFKNGWGGKLVNPALMPMAVKTG
jgi:hypothetical protein